MMLAMWGAIIIYRTDFFSGVRLFADDAIVHRTISTTSDCQTLQEDLDIVSNWQKNWLMEFNANKSEVLTVTNKRFPIKTVGCGHHIGQIQDGRHLN